MVWSVQRRRSPRLTDIPGEVRPAIMRLGPVEARLRFKLFVLLIVRRRFLNRCFVPIQEPVES